MRLVRVSDSDDQQDQLLEELTERDIDYMIPKEAGDFDADSLIEYPIPG